MRIPRPLPTVAALARAATTALTGCEGPSEALRLRGHVPARSTRVDAVTLPEARLGRPDTTFAFRARPGALLFVFFGFVSCPDICPTTLSDLRRALGMLGEDARRVDVAFVTVDLVRDSTEVLVPYLASYVAGGHALRPRTQEQLGRAQAAFGATSSVGRGRDGSVQVAHTALGYVVDEHGEVRVQWDFGTLPRDMAGDLRALLRAPTGGR
jgi:protein SCO1/2